VHNTPKLQFWDSEWDWEIKGLLKPGTFSSLQHEVMQCETNISEGLNANCEVIWRWQIPPKCQYQYASLYDITNYTTIIWEPQILYNYTELLPAHLTYYAVSPANTSCYWDSNNNNNRHRYISLYYMWSRMCWKWSTCSQEMHEYIQYLNFWCKAWCNA